MSSSKKNKLDEQKKSVVRKAMLSSSLMFITLSIYSALNPVQIAQLLNMDNDLIAIFSVILAFIAIADFAIAFIIFKPKDRV